MQENYSGLRDIYDDIPSFRQKSAYAFDALELDLYHELNDVSEEIGRCRSAALK